MDDEDYSVVANLTRVRAARDVLRSVVVGDDLTDLVQHAHLNLEQLEAALAEEAERRTDAS